MLHLSRGLQPGGRFDEWRRPPVRGVFLDVDGTSVGEHEEPTAAFVDACWAVQDRGATLSFATGRPPAGVDVVRARTGSRGADVVHNGALVLRDHLKKVGSAHRSPRADARRPRSRPAGRSRLSAHERM